MSMLNNQRNTPELLCHSMKFHRVYPPTPGKKVFIGAIVALNVLTVTAEPAEKNSPHQIVIGKCEGYTTDGRIIAKTGVYKYDNADDPAFHLTIYHINRPCFIVDDHTVGRLDTDISSPVNAGIVLDIDPKDGQVIVQIGLI